MEMGNSRNSFSQNSESSSQLKIGLEFGQKIYFEDVGIGAPPKSVSGSSSSSPSPSAGTPPKKGRSCGGGVQIGGGGQQTPPRCQVEGCNLDLTEAKAYYSRHKVCGMHSKTATVIVAGLEQRFCQQCSRFHLLPEFDQGKRSCRRRLAGHNERRRKPPPGSMFSPRYGNLSSSILENSSRPGGFLMDFSSYPKPNERDPWTNARASEQLTNNIPIAIPKFPPQRWQSSLDIPPTPDLHQSSSNRSPYPNHSVVTIGGSLTDSNCALSLLSNQPSDSSSNQSLSLGQNYYVNPNGGSMDHFSNPSWGFKSNEGSSSSPGMNSHLGLGHMSEPDSSHYSNDLELPQQSGRQYMELELSRGYGTSAHDIHWSL